MEDILADPSTIQQRKRKQKYKIKDNNYVNIENLLSDCNPSNMNKLRKINVR